MHTKNYYVSAISPI